MTLNTSLLMHSFVKIIFIALPLLLNQTAHGQQAVGGLGEFEQATDVGKVDIPGKSAFIPGKNQYRITGNGANIWYKEDAFQFLSRRLSGDIVFTMEIDWIGEGKEPHRKACAMIRQSLDADSPLLMWRFMETDLSRCNIQDQRGTDVWGSDSHQSAGNCKA